MLKDISGIQHHTLIEGGSMGLTSGTQSLLVMVFNTTDALKHFSMHHAILNAIATFLS